jgi:PAS domain S-box-containing protein
MHPVSHAPAELPEGSSVASPSPLDPSIAEILGRDGLGVLVLDADGRPLQANARLLAQLSPATEVTNGGGPRSASAATNALAMVEAWLGGDGGLVAASVGAALVAGPDPAGTVEVALSDGRRAVVRTAALPDPAGGPPRSLLLLRDVSAARQGEESARVLARAADLLGRTLDYDVLAASLARLAVPDLADWCSVDVLGDDGAFHRIGAAHVDDAGAALLVELDRRFPIEPAAGHLRGQVVATGQPIALYSIDDAVLRRISRDEAHAAMLRRLGMRAAIWVPLAVGDEILGVLSFGAGEDRLDREPFGPATLALGEDLARRASLALRNARTHRQLRDREQQQAVVAALGHAAAAGLELEALFDEAVRRLADTLRLDLTKVLELLPDRLALRLVSGVGWQPGLVRHAVVGSELASQAGYTLAGNQPVIVEDLRTETRFSGPALLHDHGVVSGMSVVIETATGPWGVLGVHSTGRRRFTRDDVHFLQSVANILGTAIERRQSEIALRERDDRLEMTLAASRTGFWDWEIATDRLFWSDEICRLHGLDPSEAPTSVERYLDLVHPDDRARFQHEVGGALERGEQFDFEFRIVWPDGSIRWTNGVGRVFLDDDGRPMRMAGLGRDITDRKRAEEERDALLDAERERNRLRDAFIGVVSHELRTPITTIYGGVKLLGRPRAIDEASRRDVLADIEAEADRLSRLVEDLLVLSRAERGQIEIDAEPIQVSLVAARTLRAEAARWPAIRFESPSGATPMPLVSGDATAIEQVLRNLLGNAAKYSEAGTSVELRLESDQHEVRIRVLDRGRGFDPPEAASLFDLFYRSPEATRAASGAGIGLYVVRRLVEAMGGRVWAVPREGGGSEFGFTLPVLRLDDEG